MRKAQIHGQVFIYILTLIITGMILLYGYSAIKEISKREKQLEFIQFKDDLKGDFETISSDYGSVETKTYNVPSKINEICFYQEGEVPDFSTMPDLNPFIRDSIVDNTTNNVFLVGNAVEPMRLARIEISDGPIVCIPITDNRLSLRIEGLGDGVLVE